MSLCPAFTLHIYYTDEGSSIKWTGLGLQPIHLSNFMDQRQDFRAGLAQGIYIAHAARPTYIRWPRCKALNVIMGS